VPCRTTGTPEAPNHRSSRTKRSFLSDINTPVDIKQTASQRSEPSSRSLLMGEHPHPWLLLHARIGRADIDVASRAVDMSSRARQLCYPRSNFSVMPRPPSRRYRSSLDQDFRLLDFHLCKNPVRLAFALALYDGFLTRLSQPLGTVDILFNSVPPQPNCPPAVSSFE
jgi:hypothetical protein